MRRVFLTADAWLPKMTPPMTRTTKTCALSLQRLHFVHSGSICNFQLSMCSSVQRYSLLIAMWLKKSELTNIGFCKKLDFQSSHGSRICQVFIGINHSQYKRSEDFYLRNTCSSFIKSKRVRPETALLAAQKWQSIVNTWSDILGISQTKHLIVIER